MTLPNNSDRMERFIHETFHEIARDEELMNVIRDLVAIIIERWDKFRDECLEKKDKDDGTDMY